MKKTLPFLTLLLVFASSCKKDPDGGKVYNVSYSIGCSDCMVVYVSDQAGTQTTEYNRNSNWSYSFKAAQNQQVLLMAYNTASSHQAVMATISLNNTVLKTQTTYCPVNGISFCVDTIR